MPNIERRDFLKLVGAGGVGVGAGYMLRESIKHPKENLIPHVVAPEEYSTGIATWPPPRGPAGSCHRGPWGYSRLYAHPG